MGRRLSDGRVWERRVGHSGVCSPRFLVARATKRLIRDFQFLWILFPCARRWKGLGWRAFFLHESCTFERSVAFPGDHVNSGRCDIYYFHFETRMRSM